MTATFRLILAVVLAGLALVAGFAAGQPPRSEMAVRADRTAQTPSAPSEAEVNGLIERIASAGLFPEAQLEAETDETTETSEPSSTAAALEAALTDPDLAAMVRSGGHWSLIIPVSATEFARIKTGDTLDNGWRVLDISPSSVTLEGPQGDRRIEAFTSVPNQNPGAANGPTSSRQPAADRQRTGPGQAANRQRAANPRRPARSANAITESRAQSGFQGRAANSRGARPSSDDDEEAQERARERRRAAQRNNRRPPGGL
ncbi:MAG: hypothetical protein AAFX09_10480 [Pseudomonadota bacterium]